MAQNPMARTEAPRAPTQTFYLPVLDGLRAVAILLVVAAHAGLERLLPGAFGVTLFFFISGYLITRQLLGSLASNRLRLANFYLRRVLRLAPAGLAYVAIAGFAYLVAGGHISAAGWFSAVFYGANIYDLWEGYRSTLAGVRHPFNILWSLAIEEHFYAAWPLLLGALWRTRWAMAAILALCLSVLCWRWWLFGHCTRHFSDVCGRLQTNPAWRYNRLYQGTDTRIDSIAWGALLAFVELRRPAWFARAASLWPLGLLMLAAGFLPTGEFGRQVLRTSVQGVALLVLFPALLTREGPVARALCTRPALWIGRLSYSLYLWHWGAFALADWLAGPHKLAWLAIGLPLSAILSVASYTLIEQPMLRLRRRIGSHPPPGLFTPA